MKDESENSADPTPPTRTVAVVAAELEAATIAASKVTALTEELRGMLFKRRAKKEK